MVVISVADYSYSHYILVTTEVTTEGTTTLHYSFFYSVQLFENIARGFVIMLTICLQLTSKGLLLLTAAWTLILIVKGDFVKL